MFLQLITEYTPKAAKTLPIIGIYFNVNLILVLISVILTIIVLNFHFRGPKKQRVPRWMRKYIIGYLGRVFCFCHESRAYFLNKNPQYEKCAVSYSHEETSRKVNHVSKAEKLANFQHHNLLQQKKQQSETNISINKATNEQSDNDFKASSAHYNMNSSNSNINSKNCVQKIDNRSTRTKSEEALRAHQFDDQNDYNSPHTQPAYLKIMMPASTNLNECDRREINEYSPFIISSTHTTTNNNNNNKNDKNDNNDNRNTNLTKSTSLHINILRENSENVNNFNNDNKLNKIKNNNLVSSSNTIMSPYAFGGNFDADRNFSHNNNKSNNSRYLCNNNQSNQNGDNYKQIMKRDNEIKINLIDNINENILNIKTQQPTKQPSSKSHSQTSRNLRNRRRNQNDGANNSMIDSDGRIKERQIDIVYEDDVGKNLEKMLIKMQRSFDPFKLQDEELKFAILKEILECQRLLLISNLKKEDRKERVMTANEIYDEWKILAMIVDRICFFIYLSALLISSAIFFIGEKIQDYDSA